MSYDKALVPTINRPLARIRREYCVDEPANPDEEIATGPNKGWTFRELMRDHVEKRGGVPGFAMGGVVPGPVGAARARHIARRRAGAAQRSGGRRPGKCLPARARRRPVRKRAGEKRAGRPHKAQPRSNGDGILDGYQIVVPVPVDDTDFIADKSNTREPPSTFENGGAFLMQMIVEVGSVPKTIRRPR